MQKRAKKPSNGSHFVAHDWMIKSFGLQGDDLIIYSIIYGFSQDGVSVYKGTTRYLCFWTGKSKETVLKRLKFLRGEHLIDRKKIRNGSNDNRYYCDYWATITRFPEDAQEKLKSDWVTWRNRLYPQEEKDIKTYPQVVEKFDQ